MSADSAHRLFFAVWPDPAIAQALHRLAQSACETAGGRCMRTDSLHMTLAFLGDVDAARLPDMLAVGADLKGRAFTLVIDRLGHWRHNRIIWAGGNAPTELIELVGKLRFSLTNAGMRVDREAFVPHVTLVRNAKSAPPSALPAPVVWRIDGLLLVESQLSGAGARYRTLARWPLGASIG